jgi:hypothetical protein
MPKDQPITVDDRINIRAEVEEIVKSMGTHVGYVSLEKYVERIFDEKDDKAEFARATLERALIEARDTTDRAMVEAKTSVEARLSEAKAAADGVNATIMKRLDNLESGGAPFASRLDLSLTEMKVDVDNLKENMVRTTVLDALREQAQKDAQSQKRQIRNLAIGFGITLFVAAVNMTFQVLQ